MRVLSGGLPVMQGACVHVPFGRFFAYAQNDRVCGKEILRERPESSRDAARHVSTRHMLRPSVHSPGLIGGA